LGQLLESIAVEIWKAGRRSQKWAQRSIRSVKRAEEREERPERREAVLGVGLSDVDTRAHVPICGLCKSSGIGGEGEGEKNSEKRRKRNTFHSKNLNLILGPFSFEHRSCFFSFSWFSISGTLSDSPIC